MRSMSPLLALPLLALLALAVGLTACDETSESIGSSCRFDDDCNDNQSCSGGVCVADSNCACPALYAPVCGANGRTYDNDCRAGCAGVAVASEGRCPDVDPGPIDRGLPLPDLSTGTDADVDLGADLGANADLGPDAAADLGPDAAADLGPDAAADLGPDAAADAGAAPGDDGGADQGN